jgi:predicted GNAT family acetyltransferase
MTPEVSTSTVEVRHDDEAGRYEILVDGQVVGFASHHDRADGAWVFDHTVIEPAHRRQGFAEQLVAGAMEDVRRRGHKVVAQCWYVDRYLDEHPADADLRA